MSKIKYLALSGGGVFGYGEVGALKELINLYGDLIDLDNIYGVSVGSMVGALYGVGYNIDEIEKIVFEMNFGFLIRDTKFAYYKLYEKYGMYEAKKLEDEIERLIQIKTNIKFCTFNQIKKNLTIISTNLNQQCPKIFDREQTPHMIISKAIRMSITYPGIMQPVWFEGNLYSDGGLTINYPITLIEKLGKLSQTIGITFAGFNDNIDGTMKDSLGINNVIDYICALGLTMNRATYIAQITPTLLKRSIIIKITENIASMQLDLTIEQKRFIYDCGVNAVKEQSEGILGPSIIINAPMEIEEIIKSIEEL